MRVIAADNINMNGEMKSIYEYTNYREFLRDWCTHAKAKGKGFSYRNFARRAGISSSGCPGAPTPWRSLPP